MPSQLNPQDLMRLQGMSPQMEPMNMAMQQAQGSQMPPFMTGNGLPPQDVPTEKPAAEANPMPSPFGLPSEAQPARTRVRSTSRPTANNSRSCPPCYPVLCVSSRQGEDDINPGYDGFRGQNAESQKEAAQELLHRSRRIPNPGAVHPAADGPEAGPAALDGDSHGHAHPGLSGHGLDLFHVNGAQVCVTLPTPSFTSYFPCRATQNLVGW
ncbi:hypothetical protein C0Q70_08253 [Pomacea canaliculata]|uniref:Uncharacterized protein n=1 Tax=Pomacea canaliculata TaxID=400727 RepID=A0A2T7PHC6_POMCA|nr:hypothetical protein C0Q70_08253 [Pomacea canaliculata]